MAPLKRPGCGRVSAGRGSCGLSQPRLTAMREPRTLTQERQQQTLSEGRSHQAEEVYRPAMHTRSDPIPVPMEEDQTFQPRNEYEEDELLNFNEQLFQGDMQGNDQCNGSHEVSGNDGEGGHHTSLPAYEVGEPSGTDGQDEMTREGFMSENCRPWIVPAGDDNFDPPSAVKKIGLQCIAPGFKVGWTTIGTCDPDAPLKWFQHFKRLYRWDPIHNDQIEANFRKKAAKILQDAWKGMRKGTTKGPKWLTNDHRLAAKVRFDTDPIFKARSEKKKQTYLAQHARNGPAVHAFGSRPAHYHKAKLEKINQRQVLPTDMFDRKFKRRDGSYLIPDAEKTRKLLEDAEAKVVGKHDKGKRVPEEELVEASATVMGVNPRTGIPYLYGPSATLISDRFSSTGSQSSASSHRSGSHQSDEWISQEMRPRLERMDELYSSQSRQEVEILDMKGNIERLMQMMQMQSDMLRLLTPAQPSPTSQIPHVHSRVQQNQIPNEENRGRR